MSSGFRAERAVSTVDGSELWVVLDAGLLLHREASDFLRCLQGATRSPHTIRAYAGRVTLFLGWCQVQGVEWRRIGLPDLARFKRSLEVGPGRGGRVRSGSTVNAVLTAVCEFLRFCARTGLVEPIVAERLFRAAVVAVHPAGLRHRGVRAVPCGASPDAQGAGRNTFPGSAFRGADCGGAGLLPPPKGAFPGDPVAAHRPSDR